MRVLVLLLALTPTFAAIHERTVTVDGKDYIVEYNVPECDLWNSNLPSGNCLVYIPSTMPPGQPHYSANITVWEYHVDGNRSTRIAVGHPFPGTWTPGGCFEDRPEDLVKAALEQKPEPGDVTEGITEPAGKLQFITGSNGTAYFSTQSVLSADGAYVTTSPAIITYADECRKGEVQMYEDSTGAIRAKVCREGKWKPAKFK